MELNPLSNGAQAHHQAWFLARTQQNLSYPPPQTSGFSNFPILAIALLAIMVTAFLLVSYYIIVIKCCLNWQHFEPLRRFSFSRDRGPRSDESWIAYSSPTTNIHRGLDELVLRDIPTFKYKSKGRSVGSSSFGSNRGERSFRGCAVCLSEFEDQEMLRVLPHCGHVFHLDCIDIWLLNNANCPLCRSSISGAKRGPVDHIVAPSSSPQEIHSHSNARENEFVVIEIATAGERGRVISREQSQRMVMEESERSKKGRRNFHHVSIMGDECIDVRKKDEQLDVNQPIRRSFSMDSVTDRQLLLQVQQIIRQNRHISNEVASSSGDSNSRSLRRPFFSFGQGRGSKSAIQPIQSDL